MIDERLNQDTDNRITIAISLISFTIIASFIAAYFVAPYFIDYYYGSQPAHTISETIPRYPLEGSGVLIIDGIIKQNVADGRITALTFRLEDYENNRINLSNEYNLDMPFPWERVKVVGYYRRTMADFGLTGMYEFVPKRILKVSK